MVRQWQTLFYEGRYSNTDLNTGHDTVRHPGLRQAGGRLRLRRPSAANATRTSTPPSSRHWQINDRPVVIDFVVSPNSMVWPMVPAGVSNDQIQVARNMTPDWEEED